MTTTSAAVGVSREWACVAPQAAGSGERVGGGMTDQNHEVGAPQADRTGDGRGVTIARLKNHRDELLHRLEHGWSVCQSLEGTRDEGRHDEFWIGLLHEYEQACRELARVRTQE